MAIAKRLIKHLEKHSVGFDIVPHKKVFTAYDLAQTLGEELNRVAKTVLVRADRKLAFVSIPADRRLDFVALQKALGAKKVTLATEAAVKKLKIKPGTTPPFGTLYNVECVVDGTLTKCRRVICRAGSYTESVVCNVKDFIAMEKPTVAKVSTEPPKRARRKPAKVRAKAKKTPVRLKPTKAPAKIGKQQKKRMRPPIKKAKKSVKRAKK
ncbi:MAG: YbaK/EbsC family protein [Candidatus Uhrbacteria bacterium]